MEGDSMRYCVRLRFYNTGQINIGRYGSATARALTIIAIGLSAEVLEEWEE